MSVLGDIAIVVATFVGPIAAVQAQKWLERQRQGEDRKAELFSRLMATRAATVSPEHVRALNMIDIVFYGRPSRTGPPKRTPAEAEVLAAWKEYYEHLSPAVRPLGDAAAATWRGRREELFINLLERIGIATNYKFDREQLRSRHYSPEAEGTIDTARTNALLGASDVLTGRAPLRVRVEAADPTGGAQ